MKIHKLIGRPGDNDHWWQSRDNKDIDCNAIGCCYNKNRKCMVPSICKIGDDGRCEGFKPFEIQKEYDGD